jgi:hypothetical protein
MYMYNYHIKNYGLYHNATGTYKITMNLLLVRKYYSCTTGKLQVYGIRVTTLTYKITMNMLWKYYSCTTGKLQVYGICVTTCHYGHYNHYKFRGKVPWFADVDM